MRDECKNDIIKDSLSIDIDISNPKSWDLNTGLTITSIVKSNKSISNNITLFDYGLTQFDAGYSNNMWDNFKLNVNDNYFKLNRVGKNIVNNPTNIETSGLTSKISYDNYEIIPVISGNSGNYFHLNGGYLQGFFKLHGYDYEIIPSRFSNGITIETALYLQSNSNGFYFMMGCRAEDKYNPHFSGETFTSETNIDGVYTSNHNLLDSYMGSVVNRKAFNLVEKKEKTIYSEPNPLSNIKNNIIGFEITSDKRLGYKYINENGHVITDKSNHVINNTGFTIINITFKPNYIITDPDILYCAKQRKGDLIFSINGRPVWIINNFPEFYFKKLDNDKEKQIGIPYNISWGGGSFGLKHSYHYDIQTYRLYDGQNIEYINDKFSVVNNQLDTINGLKVSIDNEKFINDDGSSINVMELNHTGGTNNKYLLLYNEPISLISNRDYEFKLKIYNNDFFKKFNEIGNYINNKVSIFLFSDETDIDVLNYTEYIYPLTTESITFISGVNEWCDISTVINTEINSGQKFIKVGILIETTHDFNLNSPLYIQSLLYEGADILVKDNRKNNLLIEQNFNNSFNGGIQKLRIYEKALNTMEVLNNSIVESKNNYNNINVNRGGRIIYG